MPNIEFTLPHWAYWVLVLAFPIVAMVSARRLKPRSELTLSLAYFLWLVAGYVGIHRFYLKNLWGLGYIALFVAILIANSNEAEIRTEQSNAAAAVTSAENAIPRAERALSRSERRIERFRNDLSELEEGSARRRITERRLNGELESIEEAKATIAEAKQKLETARPALAEVVERRAFWRTTAQYLFFGVLAFLALDALLMPWLLAGARRKIAAAPHAEVVTAPESPPDSRFASNRGVTGWIDRLNLLSGEFVAYWCVLGVFAFSFEVVARKLFNSPTIWVHEAVVYIFAMQYMIAGAYAMLTESHVRVDIFYAKFSPRTKAAVDLLTSVFFFIFAGTLLLSGFVFAADSLGFGNTALSALARGEISLGQFIGDGGYLSMFAPGARNGEVVFSTWLLPLWPIKFVLVLGAFLLLLQGISRVIKDAHTLATGVPHTRVEG